MRKRKLSKADQKEVTAMNALVFNIRRGFPFEGDVHYDPQKQQYLFDHTNESLGSHFIAKVEESPAYAYELSSRAWGEYRRFEDQLKSFNSKIDDRHMPLDSFIKQVLGCTVKFQTAKLDMVFDPVHYLKVLERHLTTPAKLREQILISTSPANGVDNYLSYKDVALQHLAGQFAKKFKISRSSLSQEHGTERWFQINYVPFLAARVDWSRLTPEKQKKELILVMDLEGIIPGSLEDVRQAQERLHLEILNRQIEWNNAAKELSENSKQGHTKTVAALVHFAGQAKSMDEVLHILDRRALNMMLVAADVRGQTRQKAIELIHTELARHLREPIA